MESTASGITGTDAPAATNWGMLGALGFCVAFWISLAAGLVALL